MQTAAEYLKENSDWFDKSPGGEKLYFESEVIKMMEKYSSQTEISDAGKDTADYIDRHIIESMKELAREGFKPQVSEISDKDIEKQAFKFAQEESYGEFSGDLWKGYVFGAKRMRDQLKQL